MKSSVAHLSFFLILAFLTVGHEACAGTATSPGAASKPLPKEVPLSGRILETMDGGGYTYLLLNTGGEKVWVAIPLSKVRVGQELALVPGFEMKNFNSKGLNRRFDRVIFSAGIANQGIKLSPAALKMAHQGVPVAATTPPAPKSAVAVNRASRPARVSIEQIAKARGPHAYTIAQLYAKKLKLEKKPVVVRGRVVKVSPRILKRNWVHIQDGSGSVARKTNNLIITTKDLPKVGDLVTARGTLYNNMDFGSGYRYGLLIEGARFRK